MNIEEFRKVLQLFSQETLLRITQTPCAIVALPALAFITHVCLAKISKEKTTNTWFAAKLLKLLLRGKTILGFSRTSSRLDEQTQRCIKTIDFFLLGFFFGQSGKKSEEKLKKEFELLISLSRFFYKKCLGGEIKNMSKLFYLLRDKARERK